MATWRRDSRLTGSQRLLCAGLAGTLSLSLTAPLELTTVLSQVGAMRGHARGPWAMGLWVWRTQGPRALWKGNGVACLRLFPCSIVQLASYRKFVTLFTDDLDHISQWSSIMAGSLAGMVSTIVTYPTDLIKTRLIMQNMMKPSYKGFFHAFSTIHQQEGFLALYRGVSLTVLGAFPYSAGSLLVYMNLEKIWNGPQNQFSTLQNFANVCLAAAVTQTLSFPFDMVKRKMQAHSPFLPHCGGVDIHFSGVVDCFWQIIKTQGILGLWNGLTPNLLKIVPYFGVMFSTFEFCKRIFLYQNGYIVSPLSYKLTPGVDQSLQPQELREIRKTPKPTV
ncbi:PREDICTED: solute carrier family 25 member 43 [Chrysochloris asiatica]|uniref:Solute carrier family 25 member 43 n=1 Tax=Chrysochloris asiatica TaxID=185453 RepID=A0A9B0TY08_CHRAS|nr:PREDICTED: solute carrier family 25 member 43 [Chrysochloris asiatica]